jgi:hypothetical protein
MKYNLKRLHSVVEVIVTTECISVKANIQDTNN